MFVEVVADLFGNYVRGLRFSFVYKFVQHEELSIYFQTITNMKRILTLILFLATTVVLWAYDIAVQNEDGVTIYYNYDYFKTELEVTNNDYTGVVVIPEEVTYLDKTLKVTSIGRSAFYGSSGLTSITIPASVKSIGQYAFYDCKSLTSVHISDLEAWCKIDIKGNNPLLYAHHLYLNGKEIINLEIPNSVTKIGNYAFTGCIGLTSITIPNSVTYIGVHAFSGCTNLTSVEIPNSVTSLGNFAFYECFEMTSIKIGNGVTSLGDNAFYDCSKLRDVYCYADKVPEANSSVFDGFTVGSNIENATLHVPVASINSYRETVPWSNFGTIVSLPQYKLLYYVNSQEYKTVAFDEGEYITAEPAPSKEGYTFTGWEGLPETMPAHDVTVTGEFSINSYTLTYMIDDIVYKTIEYEYGATITQEPQPEGIYISFEWQGVPQNMPAHDVTVVASYETEIPDVVLSIWDGRSSETRWYDESLSEYHLTNAAELKGFADLVDFNKCTFEGKTVYLDTDVDLSNHPWYPIGLHSGSSFKGIFNGRHHSITNVLIDDDKLDYPDMKDNIGFFGVAVGASISNIKLQGIINSKQSKYIGGIASFAKTIENVYCDIIININNSNPSYIGGVAGSVDTITKVYCKGDIKFSNNAYIINSCFLGGVAGRCDVISESCSNIDIEVNRFGQNDSQSSIGGITGKMLQMNDVIFTGSLSVTNKNCTSDMFIAFTGGITGQAGIGDKVISAPTFMEYGRGWANGKSIITSGYNSSASFDNTYYISAWANSEEHFGTPTAKDGLLSGTPIDGFSLDIWEFEEGKLPCLKELKKLEPKKIYTVTYFVDGIEYQVDRYYDGKSVIPATEPTKEGYTFSGWGYVPPFISGNSWYVYGSFTVNTYKITYVVDGAEYKTEEVEYGSTIVAETPSKEGYTFSGWQNLPEEMPAKDVTVTGTFTVNSYKVTFMYGDNVLTTIEVNYGEAIELPTSLNSERYTLVEWKDVPDTMPAHDITIYADYVDGINTITADRKDEQYIRMNGMYTPDLKPGLNIIRMKDGTTKKVWVK